MTTITGSDIATAIIEQIAREMGWHITVDTAPHEKDKGNTVFERRFPDSIVTNVALDIKIAALFDNPDSYTGKALRHMFNTGSDNR